MKAIGRATWVIEQRDTRSAHGVLFAYYLAPGSRIKHQLTLDESVCPAGVTRHVGKETLLSHMTRVVKARGRNR